MARFIKGDVVVMPFPFSDLSSSKKRPAIVLVDLDGSDLILGQITSKGISDAYSIRLTNDDFYTGSLNQDSNIRPNKIFTADSNIILYKIGHLKQEKIEQVTSEIVSLFIE